MTPPISWKVDGDCPFLFDQMMSFGYPLMILVPNVAPRRLKMSQLRFLKAWWKWRQAPLPQLSLSLFLRREREFGRKVMWEREREEGRREREKKKENCKNWTRKWTQKVLARKCKLLSSRLYRAWQEIDLDLFQGLWISGTNAVVLTEDFGLDFWMGTQNPLFKSIKNGSHRPLSKKRGVSFHKSYFMLHIVQHNPLNSIRVYFYNK